MRLCRLDQPFDQPAEAGGDHEYSAVDEAEEEEAPLSVGFAPPALL